MTAPDVKADVRARFEAVFSQPPYDLPMPRWGGSYRTGQYQDYNTQCAWEGYRAAHADLAGEVREFLDAQPLASKNDARRVWQILEAAGVDTTALAKFHPTQRAGGGE